MTGRLAVVGCLALLAGCASLRPAAVPLPELTGTLDWPQRRATLQQLAGFSLRGRVGVAAGDAGFTASLRWVQARGRGELEFDGPLGIGGLRVVASGDALALTTARGERLDGEAARAGLEQQLGFELPLRSLRYWVLGVPDPAEAAEERLASDAPRLDALLQSGWQVDYRTYSTGAGGLPRRIDVVRGATRLRLLVEEWGAEGRP